jgi:hypothetical protein
MNKFKSRPTTSIRQLREYKRKERSTVWGEDRTILRKRKELIKAANKMEVRSTVCG